MIPVVVSGGSGTRLWPVSRSKLPKQFCKLFGDSLLNLTLRRLTRFGEPWVVTNKGLADSTGRLLREMGLNEAATVYEPMGRNTAPAIAVICHHLLQKGMPGETVIGVFPADHLINDEAAFAAALALAEASAAQGQIVTLGIQPDSPATGYGYIEVVRSPTSAATGANQQALAVKGFHEKPDPATAEKYVREGGYYWNAGIFVARLDVMAAAFQRLQPELWAKVTALKSDLSNLTDVYFCLPSISIDYAIMEKLDAKDISCVPCEIGWNDVGSWDAVADLLKEEAATQAVQIASHDNFVFSKQDKKYAFVGVDDLIVVDTADATLITRRGMTQKVGEVVAQLKAEGSKLVDDHVFEDRPWGRFEILREQENFKAKVIQVLPKQQLSLQSHAQREEHWLVTQGEGAVVLDEHEIPVRPGSYVTIPQGARHRMRNVGDQVVEFVEVQMGTYFGEDDIVRYQDDYRRN